MDQYVWRKSSRSGQVNCIEVAIVSDHAAFRDSKDPESNHLVVGWDPWNAFLAGLKSGRFDRDLG